MTGLVVKNRAGTEREVKCKEPVGEYLTVGKKREGSVDALLARVAGKKVPD